jgi:hypothetical protein
VLIGYVLVPRWSAKIGLHPLAVIFAILAGGGVRPRRAAGTADRVGSHGRLRYAHDAIATARCIVPVTSR